MPQTRPPGQQRPYPHPTKTGKIPFKIPTTGGDAETAFWLWGDLSSSKVPLICLHGGPGVPHNYLLPLALICKDYGIPVILYDQVGCGASTHFKSKRGDDSFWNPHLFFAELDNLKSHLGITTFDLLGQSWGGMFAGQYAIEKQPPGLRKLLICDSPASMATWTKVTADQRSQLPTSVQDVLDRCEKEGKTDTAEYEAAVAEFYKVRVCRLWPWPKELDDSFAGLADDSTVYNTMNGPSEFYVIGSLKSWSIVDGLEKITTKTAPGGVLVANGYFDEASDECCRPFFTRPLARVKWVRFAESSHMPMLEETERFVEAVGQFLVAE